MRTWLLALMTVLVAFAGCFGDDGGDDVTTTTSTTSTTTAPVSTTTTSTSSTSTQTGEPEPDQNTPPTASISASIEQGQIPFDVNFTLDGADADGDSLSWTFDADGDGTAETDGTELPAEYTFTYTSEGVFNATLTVDDGTNETVLVLEIDATAAAAATGPAQVVDGTFQVGVSDTGAFPAECLAGDSSLSGVTHLSFMVDPATVGKPFTATITDAAGGADILDWSVFYNAEGCGDFQDFAIEGAGEISGTVPSGYPIVWILAEGGVMLEVHYEAG